MDHMAWAKQSWHLVAKPLRWNGIGSPLSFRELVKTPIAPLALNAGLPTSFVVPAGPGPLVPRSSPAEQPRAKARV